MIAGERAFLFFPGSYRALKLVFSLMLYILYLVLHDESLWGWLLSRSLIFSLLCSYPYFLCIDCIPIVYEFYCISYKPGTVMAEVALHHKLSLDVT